MITVTKIALAVLLSVAIAVSAAAAPKNVKKLEKAQLRPMESKSTVKKKSSSRLEPAVLENKTDDNAGTDEEVRAEPGSRTDALDSSDSKTMAASGLFAAGAVLCVVGTLWFIIAGFAESVLWGIALILFNGIAGLAFLVLHWKRAKSPVLTYLMGWGLILVSSLLG